MIPKFRFETHAMATTFEVVIAQDDVDETYAAQAAAAMFEEIARLEEDLSRFRQTSDIWRLGQLKAGEKMRVSLATWDCLSLSKAMFQETAGAFDVTVGPLMSLWRHMDESFDEVDPAVLDDLRSRVGSHLYDLDADEFQIIALANNLSFDLGAIGKGYALDQAAEVLRERSIHNALLNAGDSTVLGMGGLKGLDGWEVTIGGGIKAILLKDQALSGSGFAVKGSHIMNPRTLRPVPVRPQRSYAIAPTAAMSDALSTAFMIMEPAEIQALCERYPQVQAVAA